MDKTKLIELKLQNLFLLRTFASQVLIVVGGGVVGLFFVEHSIAQVTFIVLGFLLDLFFLKLFVSIGVKINKILIERKIYND